MEVDNVQNKIVIDKNSRDDIFSHSTFFSISSANNNELDSAVKSIRKANLTQNHQKENNAQYNAQGYSVQGSPAAQIIDRITKRISEEKVGESTLLLNELMKDGSKVSRKGDSYYLVTNQLTKKTKFVCIYCSISFVSKGGLLEHRIIDKSIISDTPKFICREIVNDGESNGKCQICGKTFTRPSILKSHKSLHFNAKKFICEVCKKGFQPISHLKNHSVIHTAEKNYCCNICNKRFEQSGHLLNHKRTHTREKNFECGVCNKKFTQNIHLKSHLKIHTGEKQHRCLLCGKYFAQSGHLRTHMKTHTGERKYACKVCPMRFKQSGHLRAHMRTHTGERKYACKVCPKRFKQNGHLTTHMKMHSGVRKGNVLPEFFTCDVMNVKQKEDLLDMDEEDELSE